MRVMGIDDGRRLRSIEAMGQELGELSVGEMRAAAPHVQAARDAVPKSVLAENPLGAHGPLSTVSQTFHWRETIHFGAAEAKK
jgi:hypothetical protein